MRARARLSLRLESVRLLSATFAVLVTCCGIAPSTAGQGERARTPAGAGSGSGIAAGSDLRFDNETVGAPALSNELEQRLQSAWERRPAGYKPRTRHLHEDGTPRFTNRLFLESSPYLLQHAHNPVNWYPWGDEAFETARKLGRPVLLSVGYSTCHWCHVMEEESFENPEIAKYLNEHYVAVKVDREERPDVDAIYMAAVQALTGGGGWPMTVWLTPDRKPFYGGTYFPPRDGDRGARSGFLTLLKTLLDAYEQQPENITKNSEIFVEAISKQLAPAAGDALPQAGVLHAAATYYSKAFDSQNGGLRGAPKFPSGMSVRFLLRYHRRGGDKQYLEMAERTLERMMQGGIYDHAGGGFHRYATDTRWLVPHFEKMLYDNALLAVAYLEGFQATGREDFARVAREILRYVERDMTSPGGAFFSATDADSPNDLGEREEGWFFTWTPAEIDAVLDAKQAGLVKAYYQVTGKGNFEGRNILHAARPLADAAKELDLTPRQARSVLDTAREKLYEARKRRPPPLRDEKILTAWNGLMISAHAFAALVLDEADYARRAETAAAFLLENLRRDGRLLRSYKDGQARHNAYLDDYAFLTAGLIDLYEATGNLRWLKEAIALDAVLEEHYEDNEHGGFFLTSNDHETLLAREKPAYDGAEPSGNSVAALNLLRLYEFTTNEKYRLRAERALKAFETILTSSPTALSEMLLALDFHLDSPKEIIVVTPRSRGEAQTLLAPLRATFVPNRILSIVAEGAQLDEHSAVVPLLEDKRAIGGRPTAYVCEKRVCELPASDQDVFRRQITKTEPYAQNPSQASAP
jgi:hypothetical protein